MNKVTLLALASLATASASAATLQNSVPYTCDAGVKATARYNMAPATGAVVSYGGHSFAFNTAPSGSGARYTTPVGPHAITPLEWWTKGPGATLSELGANGSPNRLIATCHAAK